MRHKVRAFTIVELLVVISIIALLIGILLPAIGKARDGAKLTQSQSHVKQLVTAVNTYASEFNDRQPTFITDNFASYGNSITAAFNGYHAIHGADPGHPWLWLGQINNTVYGFAKGPRYVPLDMWNTASGLGSYRLPNVMSLSVYMNGRFYDPVYWAPKDTILLNAVEPRFDHPSSFAPPSTWGSTLTIVSSYCFSPAAMYAPSVFSQAPTGGQNAPFYLDPFAPGHHASFRSPRMSHALFSNLKSHIAEHNWLQRPQRRCNPLMQNQSLECEPYYMNMAPMSAPVMSFYDGHIDTVGVESMREADSRIKSQNGHGTWSRDTNFGQDGYFGAVQFFNTDFATSNHFLTVEGIRGRDIVQN